ncbi:hypothetical protein Pelo_6976 [Pelomyxa schiedti]|nr:hypothetical protein Pelo_6976 [Pelomyxa schiedti]
MGDSSGDGWAQRAELYKSKLMTLISEVKEERRLNSETLAEMQSKLDEATSQRDTLESKLVRVVEMLRTERQANAAAAQGNEAMRALQEQVQRLTAENSQKSQMLEDAAADNATLTQNISVMETKCLEVAQALEETQKRCAQAEEQCSLLEEYENQQRDLNSKLAVVSDEKSKLEMQLSEFQTRINQLESQTSTQDLSAALKAEEQRRVELQERTTKLLQAVKVERENKKKEMDALEMRAISAEEKLQQLSAEVVELKTLSNTPSTNNCQCETLRDEVAQLKSECSDSQRKLQLLANKITEQQGHSAEQERNAAKLANELEGETAQRKKLSRTIAELHEELQKKNEKISSLEEQIASSGNSGDITSWPMPATLTLTLPPEFSSAPPPPPGPPPPPPPPPPPAGPKAPLKFTKKSGGSAATPAQQDQPSTTQTPAAPKSTSELIDEIRKGVKLKPASARTTPAQPLTGPAAPDNKKAARPGGEYANLGAMAADIAQKRKQRMQENPATQKQSYRYSVRLDNLLTELDSL